MGSIGGGGSGRAASIKDMNSLNAKLEKAGVKDWTFNTGFEPDDFEKQMMKEAGENYKAAAKEMLDYLRDNNLPLITPSPDYEGDIVWYYSGRDKQDKSFMSGETSDGLTKSAILETLAGNGIAPRMVYPKNIADYIIDRTNMEPEVLKMADIVTAQALKEYRDRRKKK